MKQKKVSIAIMCYNQENFIKDTIESCLNQTYKNIEICISDDYSTDKTYEIVLDYQDRYPHKIRCFQQKENMGKYSLAINANSMLSLCTWDYIALLDWDDLMWIDRIEQQVSFLEKNISFIWVSGWLSAFDSQTGKSLWNIHNHLKVYDRSTETLIIYGNSVPPCLMFRNNVSCRYDTSLKIMCDWLFYIQLSMHWDIGHINQTIWHYRIHLNNSIHKNLSFDYFKTLEILQKQYPLFGKEIEYSKSNFLIGSAYSAIKSYDVRLWIRQLGLWILISPCFSIRKCFLFIFNWK